MTLSEFALSAASSLFVMVDRMGMRTATRIMGLLLAAVAMQFMLNAARELKANLFCGASVLA